MQQIKKRSFSMTYWLALGLALFSGQACSEGGGKITLPAKTQMVLAVGQDGNIIVLDANGKPVPKCQLCTQEMEKQFGQHCEKASAKAGICAGLTGVTMQDVSTITILGTHKNPYCKCPVFGGSAYCIPVGCSAR